MIKFFNIQNLKPVRNIKACLQHKTIPISLKNDIFEQTDTIRHFRLQHCEFEKRWRVAVDAEQNLLDRAIIYKKIYNTKSIEKLPYEVGIAKSKQGFYTTYHLVEDRTKREIGFITICDFTKFKKNSYTSFLFNKNLMKDYPEYGVVGDRIVIDYIENNYQSEFSGIAKITDQIAIEYCLKNYIKPCMISESDLNSHIAHYKRGRHFFLPEEEKIKKSFIKKFGTDNPNKILQERLELANGDKVKCSDMGELLMYMPESVIQQYLEKIKQHPILH